MWRVCVTCETVCVCMHVYAWVLVVCSRGWAQVCVWDPSTQFSCRISPRTFLISPRTSWAVSHWTKEKFLRLPRRIGKWSTGTGALKASLTGLLRINVISTHTRTHTRTLELTHNLIQRTITSESDDRAGKLLFSQQKKECTHENSANET